MTGDELKNLESLIEVLIDQCINITNTQKIISECMLTTQRGMFAVNSKVKNTQYELARLQIKVNREIGCQDGHTDED